jgi:hypothetical protein
MTRQSTTPPDHRTGPQRHRALALVVVLVLLLTPAGIYLYQHRPNLYDRARTDLLEASRSLDIYSQDMETLAQKEREGAEALKETLRWLQDAASSDAADLAEIRAIEAALEDWESRVHAGRLSAGELRDRYRALEARVQRLIEKRAKVER